jgi:hypothetical protein
MSTDKKDLKALNDLMEAFYMSLLVEGYADSDIGTWFLNKGNQILEEDMLDVLVDKYLTQIEEKLNSILNG